MTKAATKALLLVLCSAEFPGQNKGGVRNVRSLPAAGPGGVLPTRGGGRGELRCQRLLPEHWSTGGFGLSVNFHLVFHWGPSEGFPFLSNNNRLSFPLGGFLSQVPPMGGLVSQKTPHQRGPFGFYKKATNCQSSLKSLFGSLALGSPSVSVLPWVIIREG